MIRADLRRRTEVHLERFRYDPERPYFGSQEFPTPEVVGYLLQDGVRYVTPTNQLHRLGVGEVVCACCYKPDDERNAMALVAYQARWGRWRLYLEPLTHFS